MCRFCQQKNLPSFSLFSVLQISIRSQSSFKPGNEVIHVTRTKVLSKTFFAMGTANTITIPEDKAVIPTIAEDKTGNTLCRKEAIL